MDKLTPWQWEALPQKKFSPEDRLRLQRSLDAAYADGFRPNEVKPMFALATSPELEKLQRLATERAMEFQQLYMHALDEAARVLLAHGCRDISRVMRPNGVEELWVGVTPSAVHVGEPLPGRCAYRQWTATDMEAGTMSVVKEWADPELHAAAVKFYAERQRP